MALRLPSLVSGKREVLHLQREVESITNEFIQARIAKQDIEQIRKVSNPSLALQSILKLNHLTINEETLRTITKELADIRASAPSVRISLAGEPTDEVKRKIVMWFRKNIDSRMLVTISVSPTLSAGFILQTEKRRYDYSFRTKLVNGIGAFKGALQGGE